MEGEEAGGRGLMKASVAATSLDEPADGGGDSSSAECTLISLKEMDMVPVAVGGGDEKSMDFLSQMVGK
jgi:hypothetical protein